MNFLVGYGACSVDNITEQYRGLILLSVIGSIIYLKSVIYSITNY